jgi:peptidyl-dipeptidase Dcp
MHAIKASIVAATMALTASSIGAGAAVFGPANPFYAPSPLPFHVPPFDRIKDEDYLPAIEAGMAEQLAEIARIADNAAPPKLENTMTTRTNGSRITVD